MNFEIKIEPIKKEFLDLAWKRLNGLTKPPGSLGKLEEIAARLVAIYENPMPSISKKAVFVFASDHGVTEEGVSAYPKEVTAQMVFNFLRGGAGINVLARHAGAEVVVVDVGVDYEFGNLPGLISKKIVKGTKNMARESAMTKDEAYRSLQIGMDMAKDFHSKGFNLLATGEMGIGNTTPSAAIISVLTASEVEEIAGKGSGIDEARLARKIDVIKKAIEINKPDPTNPIDVLAKVGGPEIGAIAGVLLGCGQLRIPVVIDGFISTAAALIAYSINPRVKDYIFASHNSVERGHKKALNFMGLESLLDLNLRLGEGTGAVLAMTIIEAGLKIYREMATFEEAGVSGEKIC